MQKCFGCHSLTEPSAPPGECSDLPPPDLSADARQPQRPALAPVTGRTRLRPSHAPEGGGTSRTASASSATPRRSARTATGSTCPTRRTGRTSTPDEAAKVGGQVCLQCHPNSESCSACHHPGYKPGGTPWVATAPRGRAEPGQRCHVLSHLPLDDHLRALPHHRRVQGVLTTAHRHRPFRLQRRGLRDRQPGARHRGSEHRAVPHGSGLPGVGRRSAQPQPHLAPRPGARATAARAGRGPARTGSTSSISTRPNSSAPRLPARSLRTRFEPQRHRALLGTAARAGPLAADAVGDGRGAGRLEIPLRGAVGRPTPAAAPLLPSSARGAARACRPTGDGGDSPTTPPSS